MTRQKTLIVLSGMLLLSLNTVQAQEWNVGIYATPVISWFKTDIDEVKNSGARAGFILGIMLETHLKDNWYFNGGLSFMTSDARLKYLEPTFFRFPGYTSVIGAGEKVIYKIQYLAAPFEIKIKTPPAGTYRNYFATFGLDPKVAIRRAADIPSISIRGEGAKDEIKLFNVGYHLTGGVEFETRGSTSFILGLGYESNIFDSTKDNDGQLIDRAVQKLMKFIFGVKF